MNIDLRLGHSGLERVFTKSISPNTTEVITFQENHKYKLEELFCLKLHNTCILQNNKYHAIFNVQKHYKVLTKEIRCLNCPSFQ